MLQRKQKCQNPRQQKKLHGVTAAQCHSEIPED
jgi:hypothetical protein